MVDVTVLGISLQEGGPSPVLLLHPTGTRRVLSVGIGPMEAVALSTALHGAESLGGKSAAPLTHELLLNAAGALGAELSAVELVGFADDEFTARAVFAKDGANVRVACRPADGVTLALRAGAAVRCAEALLDQAESIDAVMAALPEHVRTLAAAKLSEQGGRDVPEWLRVPLAVEEALAARVRNGAVSAHEDLVSVARKMLEEDDARRRQMTPRQETPGQVSPNQTTPRQGVLEDRRGPRIVIEPQTVTIGSDRAKSRTPQIRVTMVRHTGKSDVGIGEADIGEAGLFDDFEVPAGGIPKAVLVGLGLSRKEAEAVNGVSEDERWAMLLRMLAPSTKVPM